MNILRVILILYTVSFSNCAVSTTGSFLHISDIEWNNQCTEDECVKESFSSLLNNLPEIPEFILWSCAGGEHFLSNIQQIKSIAKKTLVFPSLSPIKLPFSETYHPYYQDISKYFGNWLGSKALKTFWKGGYYSQSLTTPKGLQIIVLNTAFFCKFHYLSKLDDPAGQWTWLALELTKARNKKKTVYLLMSLTLDSGKRYDVDGKIFAQKHFERYTATIKNFSDVIRGQFGGYAEEEKFHIFRFGEDQSCGWLILTPPFYRAARLYYYDLTTINPIDYIQFHNLKGVWKVKYRFTEHYSVPNMSTFSFEEIIKTIKENDDLYLKSIKKSRRYIDVIAVLKSIAERIKVIFGPIQFPSRPYQPKFDNTISYPKLKICNHFYANDDCKRVCFCMITAYSLGMYVDCVSKRKYIYMGASSSRGNLYLIILLYVYVRIV